MTLSPFKLFALMLVFLLTGVYGCNFNRGPNSGLDTSPRKPVLIPTEGVTKAEAQYKFTGFADKADTQLAWKVNLLVESLPPQPPPTPEPQNTDNPFTKALSATPLKPCLTLSYKLMDRDDFVLFRKSFNLPVEKGKEASWEITQWVPQQAAILTAKIEVQPEIAWSWSCQ